MFDWDLICRIPAGIEHSKQEMEVVKGKLTKFGDLPATEVCSVCAVVVSAHDNVVNACLTNYVMIRVDGTILGICS